MTLPKSLDKYYICSKPSRCIFQWSHCSIICIKPRIGYSRTGQLVNRWFWNHMYTLYVIVCRCLHDFPSLTLRPELLPFTRPCPNTPRDSLGMFTLCGHVEYLSWVWSTIDDAKAFCCFVDSALLTAQTEHTWCHLTLPRVEGWVNTRTACHREYGRVISVAWVKSLGKPSQKKKYITTYVLW